MAQEISEMKQIVLSLQSYTMDVNRILMEEKLRKDTENIEMAKEYPLNISMRMRMRMRMRMMKMMQLRILMIFQYR